jgi:LysM repeat protein
MRAMTKRAASMSWVVRLSAGVALAAGLAGCDLLTVSQTGRNIREGNEAVVRGEVQTALQHFETALDGTMLSAEAHYRLGMLYEDQLKNEVGALHHFERYLELAPQGQFATDVKGYVDRLRLLIVSRFAEGAVMPAREASRLKNENLALQRQLTDVRQQAPAGQPRPATASPAPAPVATPAMVVAAMPPPTPAPAVSGEPEVRRALPVTATVPASGPAAAAPRAEPSTAAAATDAPVRTYKVVSGDTLNGIARKLYQNSSQWPKILEANKGTLEDPTKLKPGMILIIPQ